MVRCRVIIMLLLLGWIPYLFAREVFIEGKGAYFLPTNSRFKDCYKGSGLFGSELTFQLKENKPWYCFASFDYFKQHGRFLHLCDFTTLRMLPLTLGIKYFIPLRKSVHLYLGLGFQATYMSKKSRNACVTSKKSLWGYGGIGKIGSSIQLPHHVLLDLFCDYSFGWTRTSNFYGHKTTCLRVNISGFIFGGGLGFNF